MNTKQVIVIRKDLNMRKGKMVAQGSHASMAFLTKNIGFSLLEPLDETNYLAELVVTKEQIDWMRKSFTKVCVSAKDEEELETIAKKAEEAGLTVHRVIDNGLTEFNGVKTFTAVAVGPHYEDKFIGITDTLPLL